MSSSENRIALNWCICFDYLREASRYLVEVLEAVSPPEVDDVIERVLDAVEKQPRE